MDALETITDRGIRRGLGLAGLLIVTVMLALSADPTLALRSGGNLLALVAVLLLGAAWQLPRRDLRACEAWLMRDDLMPLVLRDISRREMQRRLRDVLRRRLRWHAERVGALAVATWAATALLAFAGGG